MVWAAIMAGFVAGVVHVLSGPDHLAAVAPLAVDRGRRAWRTGLQWGLGHCAGVLLIGVLALLFREMLPLDSLSSWAEKVVGLLLIALGAWGMCKMLTHRAEQPPKAAFVIGTVHGLAGSSHLLGVVPALLFPGPITVCGYFIGFGAGTIAAMTAFSTVSAFVPRRMFRVAVTACSAAAIVIGCYWLIT
jgi:sulfite exporter TauE/SafE